MNNNTAGNTGTKIYASEKGDENIRGNKISGNEGKRAVQRKGHPGITSSS